MKARSMDESIKIIRSTKRYLKSLFRTPKSLIAWLRERGRVGNGLVDAVEEFANLSTEHDDVYIRVNRLYESVKGYSPDNDFANQIFIRIECLQHGIFLLVRPSAWLNQILQHEESMSVDYVANLANKYYLESTSDVESSN